MSDGEIPSKDFSAKGKAGYLVVGFGAFILLFSGMDLYQNGIWQNWSTATGTITKSWIDYSSMSSQSDLLPEDRTTFLYPKVEYEFEVDGKKYKGRIWKTGQFADTDLKTAERKLAQYPVGKRVPVYYSPEDPSRCVLRPSDGSVGMFGIGLLILVIGVVITRSKQLKAYVFSRKSGVDAQRTHAKSADKAVDLHVLRNTGGPLCPRCVPPQPLSPNDCLGCHGRLLREQAANALLKDLELDAQTARDLMKEMGVPVLTCPSCRNKMHQGPLRGSVVDLCLSCGAIWLDAGELQTSPRA